MSGKPLTDTELIAGCIRREGAAWDLFVERFGKLILWSVRRTVANSPHAKNEAVVRDIFQDVFRALLEKAVLEKLRDPGRTRKFLVVLACRTALDHLRGLRRREAREETSQALRLGDEDPGRPAPDFADTDSPGPREAAEAREREALVGELLKSLTERERACLDFHYRAGKTHREIALLLGLPQDTVSTILRRSKEKLKKRFLERGFEA